MFQRILLPVDLSERHDPSLKAAAELAGRSKGEVTLLHVIEQIAGLSLDEERPFYERLEKKARAHLDRLGRRLDDAGIRWHAEVRVGHSTHEIARVAREGSTDLIVLLGPPPNPENPLAGWGSLSFRVELVAPCAVLLVR